MAISRVMPSSALRAMHNATMQTDGHCRPLRRDELMIIASGDASMVVSLEERLRMVVENLEIELRTRATISKQ
jgi:hypothetical protein